jgi:hypothetical protein
MNSSVVTPVIDWLARRPAPEPNCGSTREGGVRPSQSDYCAARISLSSSQLTIHQLEAAANAGPNASTVAGKERSSLVLMNVITG